MVVYSDELCHALKGWTKPGHKYIKREWKNGHWRYYYSTKPDTSLKGTLRRISGIDQKKMAEQLDREYSRAKSNAEGYSEIRHDKTRQYWYTPEKERQLREDAEVKQIKAWAAINRYRKTPIGHLDSVKGTINDGRDAVADMLVSLSEKVRSKR